MKKIGLNLSIYVLIMAFCFQSLVFSETTLFSYDSNLGIWESQKISDADFNSIIFERNESVPMFYGINSSGTYVVEYISGNYFTTQISTMVFDDITPATYDFGCPSFYASGNNNGTYQFKRQSGSWSYSQLYTQNFSSLASEQSGIEGIARFYGMNSNGFYSMLYHPVALQWKIYNYFSTVSNVLATSPAGPDRYVYGSSPVSGLNQFLYHQDGHEWREYHRFNRGFDVLVADASITQRVYGSSSSQGTWTQYYDSGLAQWQEEQISTKHYVELASDVSLAYQFYGIDSNGSLFVITYDNSNWVETELASVIETDGNISLGTTANSNEVVVSGAELWRVSIDFSDIRKSTSSYYAGANINNAANMMNKGTVFDAAVEDLGIKFYRFQGPILPGPDTGGSWDYANADNWTNNDFSAMDAVVEKAYDDWGAEKILFNFHTLKEPVDSNGMLLLNDFDDYADAVAKIVQRYGSSGNVQIQYWEPFNEMDHPVALSKLASYGQSFDDLVDLFRIVAIRIKQINPNLFVVGPAMVYPKTWEVEDLLYDDADKTDFISWHDYSTGSAETTDAHILKTITHTTRFRVAADDIKDTITYCENTYNHPDVGMIMSEFHLSYRPWSPTDTRLADQFGGVFVASVLSNMSYTDVNTVMVHDVISAYYGLVNYADSDVIAQQIGLVETPVMDPDEIFYRPSGMVYKWFNEWICGDWVDVDFDVPSEVLNDLDRGTLIDVAAWKSQDAGFIMVINKSESDKLVSLELNNYGTTNLDVEHKLMVEGLPATDSFSIDDQNLDLNMPEMSVVFLRLSASQ